MALAPGSRLGPYEILGAIGAGGMGEVYKARDSKLGRDVAIKVLPDLFARDPERLARFEREARTLAALNHPHIAQVFGVESGALVMEFVDGQRTTVYDSGADTISHASYSPTGHLVFVKTGGPSGVWAVPFSLSTSKVTGDAFPVAAGGALPSVAADGTLLYVALSRGGEVDLMVWLDREGRVLERVGPARAGITDVALSPDGGRIAFAAQENDNTDIWIHDLARGVTTRLTSGPERDVEPSWSPRGDLLLLVRMPVTNPLLADVIARSVDREGDERVFVRGRMPQLSADGRLLYLDPGAATLAVARISDDGMRATPTDWSAGASDAHEGAISPDGALLAYVSSDSGTPEVYLRRFPEGRGKWQVSLDGGRNPRWARASGELFFVGGSGPTERALMAVEVRRGGENVSIGAPRRLFKDADASLRPGSSTSYDPSADGRRLLMVRPVSPNDARLPAAPAEPRLVVVQNWIREFAGKR